MAKIEINWQINNFQSVMQAYDALKQKDKETSELAAANVRKRKAELDSFVRSMKASSDEEKKMAKQVYDEKNKLERQALKDFENYQKQKIQAEKTALREFEKTEKEKTRIAKREQSEREKQYNAGKSGGISGLVNSSVSTGVLPSTEALSGMLGSMTTGLVGTAVSVITAGIKIAVGSIAAGMYIGRETGKENEGWTDHIYNSGNRALSRSAVSTLLKNVSMTTGLDQGKVGGLANEYQSGGGTLNPEMLMQLSKLQSILPHSDLGGLAKSLGSTNMMYGGDNTKTVYALNAARELGKYGSAKAEDILGASTGLAAEAKGLGFSGSMMGFQVDAMKLLEASAGKFGGVENAKTGINKVILEVFKNKDKFKSQDLYSMVQEAGSKAMGADGKMDINKLKQVGITSEDSAKAIALLYESMKNAPDAIKNFKNAVNGIDKDFKDSDSSEKQIAKIWQSIKVDFQNAMVVPMRNFAEWLKSNGPGMSKLISGFISDLGRLMGGIVALDKTFGFTATRDAAARANWKRPGDNPEFVKANDAAYESDAAYFGKDKEQYNIEDYLSRSGTSEEERSNHYAKARVLKQIVGVEDKLQDNRKRLGWTSNTFEQQQGMETERAVLIEQFKALRQELASINEYSEITAQNTTPKTEGTTAPQITIKLDKTIVGITAKQES